MTALELTDLGPLFDALGRAGYTVIGPTVRDDAIVLDQLASAGELPHGWGVALAPGGYRVRRRDDGAAFAHAAGPQSWKPFLHRSRVKLWEADRTDGFTVREPEPERPRLAFFGVRPCDLRAIAIQDRVLMGGEHVDPSYAGRRRDNFIVAVNCTEPGETCFCTSMGTGPEAGPGYDLALTELIDGNGPRYVVDVGTGIGGAVMDDLRPSSAAPEDVERARTEVTAAADRMGREMPPPPDLHDLMAASLDAERWDDVAERCLSCGNCTMVCPTCFCTRVTDTTDLTGDHAERWQLWDSCFDLDFSHLHGGDVRASPRSRYRQWLTHKVGTWHDQFGSSGCVGCGRCIVWCPVGIDITEEVSALREEAAERGGVPGHP
ncbi:4Fe-4S dicluster domain-containing protein [Actinomadura sp. WMMB 499]|uniref:4Fe-4S dicluster domain-containing protein n=1 Tax=Actinomadura sp. WMMB 499 TaxID=1219491 RepID=UPI001247B42B|nr:4Fe-4S dicluster domain-containing protein [Actinomadura sp. WMMB 499]QFG21267.1 4Fe-4S ferredoxin [Actinomadura sp. WMMB 499]